MSNQTEGNSRLVVEIPFTLHKKLKVHAAETGKPIKDIVIEQLRALLGDERKEG